LPDQAWGLRDVPAQRTRYDFAERAVFALDHAYERLLQSSVVEAFKFGKGRGHRAPAGFGDGIQHGRQAVAAA
jgi:hypothetical protein